jgi:hypothetical protein
MKHRTLITIGLGLPATVVASVVLAQSDHISTPAPMSATTTKASPTPQVSINGQTIPVTPNTTTHYRDASTQATISATSTPATTSTTSSSGSTTVNVSQTSNGGDSSTDVSTSGNNSVSITSSSSIEANGSGVTITSP